MRVFKTKWFVRFARREGIRDDSLIEAVRRAEGGIVDADLGYGLVKQRVARAGQGRSGGYRVLIAFRPGARAVFFFGFAKKARASIDDAELQTAREVAAAWLAADDRSIMNSVEEGRIEEVDDGDEETERADESAP